jgi:serine protease Do
MLIGGVVWINLSSVTLGKTSQLTPPKLTVEKTPLSREVKLATSFSSVVKDVAPSVVYVTNTKVIEKPDIPDNRFSNRNPFFPYFDEPRRQNYEAPSVIGSGVIVSSNGYILTNNHVVSDSEEIVVTLKDQTTEFSAHVVGADPHTDIAVLKIESNEPLPAVTLSDSDTLEIGDVVLALGNPFGVGQTVTMGIVSATGRSGYGKVNVGDFIQTDASINPGNSGGALVDAEGRLVGINTMLLSRSGGNQGIGFAVPVNMAMRVMNQVIEFGDIQRGLLGIVMQRLDESLAKQFGMDVGRGVLVGDVTGDGPADKAGIKAGDVILEFDGQPVNRMQELKLMVAESRPGSMVAVRILREGGEETIRVKVGRLPEEGYAAVLPRGEPERGNIQHDALDGVTVSDVTSIARSEFGIPRNIKGALVTNVERGSPSDLAELARGDVITSIERKSVQSAGDAVELSERIQKQTVLLRVWCRGAGSRFVVVDSSEDRRR